MNQDQLEEFREASRKALESMQGDLVASGAFDALRNAQKSMARDLLESAKFNEQWAALAQPKFDRMLASFGDLASLGDVAGAFPKIDMAALLPELAMPVIDIPSIDTPPLTLPPSRDELLADEIWALGVALVEQQAELEQIRSENRELRERVAKIDNRTEQMHKHFVPDPEPPDPPGPSLN